MPNFADMIAQVFKTNLIVGAITELLVLQIKLKIENKIESGSMIGSLPFPPEVFTQVENLYLQIRIKTYCKHLFRC